MSRADWAKLSPEEKTEALYSELEHFMNHTDEVVGRLASRIVKLEKVLSDKGYNSP